ncbi:ABC transporter permease [Arthrobacter sp. NPDC093125]|uniref:ABC transporter permease n=1 Tax=unclassified Arthrobacter TaxID=235627 RepID=UPI0037F64223
MNPPTAPTKNPEISQKDAMSTTASSTQERPSTKTAKPGRNRPDIGTVATSYGVIIFLVLMIIVFSALLPDTFPTSDNVKAILTDQSIPVILALAAILPLAAGEFDLSLGAVLGFSAITAIALSNAGAPLPVVILACLAVGAGVGIVNAVLVVKVGVNAFIATLASATILSGLNLLVTGSSLLVLGSEEFGALTITRVFDLQVVLGYAIVLSLLLFYVVEKTPYGRYLRATGMGRDAARLSGVRVDRYLASSFIAAGVLAALAGALLASRGGTAAPNLGPEFLLPAYAAAFLGATTIKPGYFNVWGTVIGVVLLAVGSNGLTLLGAQTWVTNIFNGVALMLAVSASVLVGKRRRKATS